MNTQMPPGAIVTRDDPQMLVRLLSRMLDVSEHNEGEILLSDIIRLGHDCGYYGQIPLLCQSLISQGFLTRNENGTYGIYEFNRSAIQQFRIEFDPQFFSEHLSVAERSAILSKIAAGSDAGRTALRIARLLSDLQREFQSLGMLKLRNADEIAKHATTHFIDSDRAWWLLERKDACIERAFKLKPSVSFGGLGAFALAINDAHKAHEKLLEVTEKLEQEYDILHHLTQDEEMIKTMRQLGNILDRLIESFIKADIL